MSLALIVETDGGKGRDDLGLVSEDSIVTQNEVKNRSFGFRTVNVVFNVESSNFLGRRETFNLAIGELEPTSWETRRNAHPLLMARIRVDFPVPFLPQRPYRLPRLRRSLAVFNKILAP